MSSNRAFGLDLAVVLTASVAASGANADASLPLLAGVTTDLSDGASAS